VSRDRLLTGRGAESILHRRHAVGAGLNSIVGDQVGAGNTSRRLEDDRHVGDWPVLGIEDLNHKGFLQRLPDSATLIVPADDRNFGGLPGTGEEELITTAGSGRQDTCK